MSFQIVVDDTQVKNYLKRFPRQVPFAMSLALNQTAMDVRNHIVKNTWRSSVDVKARGFAGRAFRIKWSNKNNLQSFVFADPRRVSPEGIEAIDRTARGIRHYPFSSRWLAVPTFKALTGRGRLKKAAKEALTRNAPDTFVKDLRGLGPAIWRRKRDGRLEMLFVLKPSVDTPKVFSFYSEAARIASSRWDANVRRAVIKAVKTSREGGFSNAAPGRRAAFRITRGRLR